MGKKSKSANLRQAILKAINNKCYNSTEVCRVINKFAPTETKPCYARIPVGFVMGKNVTRKPNCNIKERGCKSWNLNVLNALKQLEKKGLLKSRKVTFFDRTRWGKKWDVFRFWFINPKACCDRIARSRIDFYTNKWDLDLKAFCPGKEKM